MGTVVRAAKRASVGGLGKCISAFSNKRIPYCVKFNPDADKQHQFLAGCSDKKIIQV